MDQNSVQNSQKQTQTDQLSMLKEFYNALYGTDEPVNDEKILTKYVSKNLLDKMSAMTSDPENLILDYDPFLQGQDYHSKTLMASLVIKQLKNNDEVEVKFSPLPNTKETRIVYQVIEQDKNWKINNILSDDIINKTKVLSTKGDSYELDKSTIISNGNHYSIVVMEKNDKKNKENVQHNSNPIIIYKKNQKILENLNLIFPYNNNCPADGFQKVVSKSNYFTIEQTYCKDFMFVNSFTTFRINEKGKIYLYKYGEKYTDRSNPDKEIPDLIKTEKNFQKIKFEDITTDFLLKISK